MDTLSALIGLVVLVAATAGIGVYVQRRPKRVRRDVSHEVVDPRRLGAESLGESATLLQFSTEMCTRCPGVHRMLAQTAAAHPGVLHLDVDLTHRPDIARHFHVLQTPTTLVLDRDGVIRTRLGGVPGREVLDLELTRLTGATAHA
ncbi:TlpA family protein disulfide reductase [Microbacterium aurantiacum]|uniref:Thioredoxin family protein n=2 Tax=Microbacterium aurantiacum TaxID=162393 RepID=A0AAJ2HLZ7_9MICO|nr:MULTISPECIES: thioredoxin family protein [Microbacterium]ODT09704.1 MAG: thiol reductase thioredoxin [Microbacterium sp. SCN 70-18]ANG85415.1 thiol reductase thioredoxin [Microbacterium chocolatum]KOS10966.1 thiol-disulfide isomerase [Microbacterium chocolatum]MBN9200106.1 thioredoxin family protein [Microbacterium chocolatum]MDN4463716.1 thioredoxin family protein [Microbacterium aurantiacum]